ncbi:thioredoxin reductase (NADPH) [Methanohalophilus levihalophilus]|uniref:thioredoxin-disulfide reductase n=1 Tax=Methanohalophilus levihalophilus TaxID=1431282 RepID=UPI001AE81799|nr:thioredoxin-disulfide reductase [Methanohalophilus levihalophilus]MBP2031218.1 thioredoxin reductase (NADPH) [Methanohalophilus levihalophilus]
MHDLVIVGAGPAGLTAAIYAVRYGLDVLLIDTLPVGGQISSAKLVENYPGFQDISGIELMERFVDHAKDMGVSMEAASVSEVVVTDDGFETVTDSDRITSKAVIIATGAAPKLLGVPGESEFTGRGVSYCATCDGPFFSGKEIAVIGGGESAITDALVLSDIAKQVTVIHRRDTLRASQILQERAFSRENIDFIWNTVVEEISGEQLVDGVNLKNVVTGENSRIPIDGVFIYVGVVPNTDFVDVKKNDQGFIMANEAMETSVPGLFAAGDCRKAPLYQVITAAADGAVAAYSTRKYVRGQ